MRSLCTASEMHVECNDCHQRVYSLLHSNYSVDAELAVSPRMCVNSLVQGHGWLCLQALSCHSQVCHDGFGALGSDSSETGLYGLRQVDKLIYFIPRRISRESWSFAISSPANY